MQAGRLITFEGGEGSGKSTQARLLAEILRAQGHRVTLTREPGGTPLAEAIRELVLGNWTEGMDGVTELLLMFAARAAHLHGLIQPALAQGQIVICDRFIDSSHAYQGGGQGIDGTHLAALEALVMPTLRIDLTFILDLPVAQGLARARARGQTNRFEDAHTSFMQRVREAFLQRAAQFPDRCAVIDASAPRAAVTRAIEDRVAALLQQRAH